MTALESAPVGRAMAVSRLPQRVVTGSKALRDGR